MRDEIFEVEQLVYDEVVLSGQRFNLTSWRNSEIFSL